MTEGVVPRHSDCIGEGPASMFLSATDSDELEDCWTRVLRRSAGCRRKALVTPEPRPAAKWNATSQVSVAESECNR